MIVPSWSACLLAGPSFLGELADWGTQEVAFLVSQLLDRPGVGTDRNYDEINLNPVSRCPQLSRLPCLCRRWTPFLWVAYTQRSVAESGRGIHFGVHDLPNTGLSPSSLLGVSWI